MIKLESRTWEIAQQYVAEFGKEELTGDWDAEAFAESGLWEEDFEAFSELLAKYVHTIQEGLA